MTSIILGDDGNDFMFMFKFYGTQGNQDNKTSTMTQQVCDPNFTLVMRDNVNSNLVCIGDVAFIV